MKEPAAARGVAAAREGRALRGTLLLSAPPLLWLSLFFLAPIVIVGAYSVGLLSLFPGQAGFSLDAWNRFLSADSIYLKLFWKSVAMALGVSVAVVVLAYPIAYFLALAAGRRRYVLLLLIIAPFLTSFLLRVVAWRVILGDTGVVNSFLAWVGLRAPGHPIPWLIYSWFTVVLVLVYVWVPFVALPIFVTLENLDRSLLEAAADLGAGRWTTFRRVTLPLSLPGVVAAFVFVFIPTIGEFVTPQLVGGTSGYMYGQAVSNAFLQGLDWQTGSVLALFLLVVVAGLMAVFGRSLQVRSVAAG